MNTDDEIKELRRRIEELEKRPIYIPHPYIPPTPIPQPYNPWPNSPWIQPPIWTCTSGNLPPDCGSHTQVSTH